MFTQIKNYSKYEVNELGQVRVVKTQKILSPVKCRTYIIHRLFNDTTKKFQIISAHKLVALTFITNDDPENKKQVNHIDLNTENNKVENLEWCTNQQNIIHFNEHKKNNTIEYQNRMKQLKKYELEQSDIKKYKKDNNISILYKAQKYAKTNNKNKTKTI